MYSIIDLGPSELLFCTCADLTNSDYIIDVGKWWSSPKQFCFFNNQYNDLNTGFKVFYDRIVKLYVHFNVDSHTYKIKKRKGVTLQYMLSLQVPAQM